LQGDFAQLAGRAVPVEGLRPDPDSGLPLPAWPSPGPVLVLSGNDELAFIHVGEDQSLATKLVHSWSKLRDLPDLPAEDNYAVSRFSNERRFLEDNDDWRPIRRPEWSEQCGVFLGCPPDKPDTPALSFVRRAEAPFGMDASIYQWLGRIPSREGTLFVFRFRARAEEGNGRLSFSVHLPLRVPKNDQGETAVRLRKIAVPHNQVSETAEENVLDFGVTDSVQPSAEWQTYYVIFSWPPFCKSGEFRNMNVDYSGKGKVWVDKIEAFPWQLPQTP
jgi:hypothetical protein